jgi:hypothetical protein
VEDIAETFTKQREINMKLNPKKCSFGVEEGKFLGVVVTKDGFQENPEKVDAVLKMSSPKLVKDVQTLSGRLVALNRFLSKHAERTLPFMETLRKCTDKKKFNWTSEAEEAFQDLKKYLSHLPTLTAPVKGEKLIMYLSAGVAAVSVVLMTEREGVLTPIYFISRVLKDAETRYSPMEKLTLSLVHASRRLKRYFLTYTVEVQTEQPIQQVLRKPEISGRLAKWAIELGPLEIEYKPRTAIKGQVLADFLTEIPQDESTKEEVENLQSTHKRGHGSSTQTGPQMMKYVGPA